MKIKIFAEFQGHSLYNLETKIEMNVNAAELSAAEIVRIVEDLEGVDKRQHGHVVSFETDDVHLDSLIELGLLTQEQATNLTIYVDNNDIINAYNSIEIEEI